MALTALGTFWLPARFELSFNLGPAPPFPGWLSRHLFPVTVAEDGGGSGVWIGSKGGGHSKRKKAGEPGHDVVFFYVAAGIGQITSSLTSDVYLVQDALSGKLSLTLTASATCISAFVNIFVEAWRLALVLLSAVVAIAVANAIGTRYAVRYNRGTLDALAMSNSIADKALRSYKHVTAFGIHQPLVDKRGGQLNHVRSQSTKRGCRSGKALSSSSVARPV
ncbi:ABC transporter type 1, transmembrane domain-containing protein [Xylaria arbuscula]|nr:ABC transporter type 1, transmembrane domain-containing protein [Xylaria arbuscula]